ncbi:pilus assembly protein [Cytobacillus sp. FJAT-54145]|uniref:Pilus assembly protein n=1 Tax=Cytobacillus spartinae TaxID=3299023 RepID=A0ABW6KM13_9BACI
MRKVGLRPSLQNEKGAISIEFLGILPFFFLFFLLLWQVVGTGYAVFTAKIAVSDAAKTFAVTNSTIKAIETAKETIGSSTVLKYKDLQIPEYSVTSGKFKIVLYAEHSVNFIPEKWRDYATLELEQEVHGKVLNTP